MMNLEVTRKIKCDFTAEQWQLYTNSFPYSETNRVAKDLNESLEVLYNDGRNQKAFVLMTMMNELKRFRKYGAADSEAMWFLERVVNQLYGE